MLHLLTLMWQTLGYNTVLVRHVTLLRPLGQLSQFCSDIWTMLTIYLGFLVLVVYYFIKLYYFSSVDLFSEVHSITALRHWHIRMSLIKSPDWPVLEPGFPAVHTRLEIEPTIGYVCAQRFLMLPNKNSESQRKTLVSSNRIDRKEAEQKMANSAGAVQWGIKVTVIPGHIIFDGHKVKLRGKGGHCPLGPCEIIALPYTKRLLLHSKSHW